MAPEPGIQLQDVRGFTVRILKRDTDEIVGTGVVVTAQGGVVTCAHVVEAALGAHPRDAGDASVTIWFPRLEPSKRRQSATVAGFFASVDDDVVLLQVTGTLMLRPDEVAQLGRAEPSKRNDFESYGYRRLADFAGGWAYGTIQGPVEAPDNGVFHVEPVQLRSDQINAGMSGAGILDRKRNLVVGLVSDTWFPDRSTKDRDTAWAVDNQVLAMEPFSLPLRDDPLPLLPAPQPRADKAAAMAAVAADLGVSWNTAPSTPTEWVGRSVLLRALSEDWADPDIGIIGLIGLGGEGKSTVARKWVEDLLADKRLPQPDGVFWWGFYEKPNAEEFFTALLAYMAKGKIDVAKITSTGAKAQIVGAMLASGRYLFVLDGFEVMQYQEGDRYGEVQSYPLVEFLAYIASHDHASCAVITSRVQLDLGKYATYREREVARLAKADGVALLRAVGCRGSDDALARVVEDWDGHALTLHLMGSYVVDKFGGDVANAASIPAPTALEHHYDRVQRILHRYDAHFTASERGLLMLICACRIPAPSSFVSLPSQERLEDVPPVLQPLVGLDEAGSAALIGRLRSLRILRHEEDGDFLTVHPLIRSHYQQQLKSRPEEYAQTHLLLTIGYMNVLHLDLEALLKEPDKKEKVLAVDELPAFKEILPGVEAVYHAGQAGRHELGILIHANWIGRDISNYLSSRYGAHETELDLCLNFFPERDVAQAPIQFQSYQNKVAMPLIALGRISPAVDLLKRNTQKRIEEKDWANACMNFPLLSQCYILLGELALAERAMRDALAYLERTVQDGLPRAGEVAFKRWAYQAELGWIVSVRGHYDAASEIFKAALESAASVDLSVLISDAAIQFAEHIMRVAPAPALLDLLETTRAVAEGTGRRNDLLQYRLARAKVLDALGDDTARQEFDLAMQNAQEWGRLNDVVSAQIARGTFAARHGDTELAKQDLNTAMARAVEAQFKLHEIDANVGLGWAWLADGDRDQALVAATRAARASEEIGYSWGTADADALLQSATTGR